MAHSLLIVESPSKAKTLEKYLGHNYEVLASYGPWWAIRGRLARMRGDDKMADMAFIEAVAQVTEQYGLDLPPWQQYLNWIAGVLQGDFGRSLQYRQDVSTVIGERLPVTLGLVVMAGAMIAIVAIKRAFRHRRGRFATGHRAVGRHLALHDLVDFAPIEPDTQRRCGPMVSTCQRSVLDVPRRQ